MPVSTTPGVPALLVLPRPNEIIRRITNRKFSTIDTGTTPGSVKPQWGIYLRGSPAITVDSISSFEIRKDSKIADYPVEDGAFQSYNKVQLPFDSRVRITRGGNDADRAVFLAALDGLQASLEQYDIVTPERVYTGVNIQRYDLKRTAREGAGLLVAELWLVQVRDGATATFVTTKAPTGAQTVNAGALQAQPASQPVANRLGTAY